MFQSGEGHAHHNERDAGMGEFDEHDEEDLPEVMDDAPAPAVPPEAPVQDVNVGIPFRNGGLGAAHQALLQREGPAGYIPYMRPPLFFARIVLLLIVMCISLSVASTIFLTLPGKFT